MTLGSLKLKQGDSGCAKILGVPIHTLGDDQIKIRNIVFDLTLEIHKALSSTKYSGKKMKRDSDV